MEYDLDDHAPEASTKETRKEGSTRRRLLGVSAAAAALTRGARAQGFQSAPLAALPQAPATQPKYRPLEVPLVQRCTFGFDLFHFGQARVRGFEGYLEWQLDHLNIDDSFVDAKLAALPSLGMTGKQIYDNYNSTIALQEVPRRELRAARILRAVHSKRQLFERMVEFWSDHFNVHIDFLKRDTVYLKTVEDRDVIRQHALGNFKDLLHADARSGAMLAYLDNKSNKVGAANENYAREVMELHTLGADGPYTEDDVRELARCFTGWNFFPTSHAQYGDFRFIAADHDSGMKVVLGNNIPAGGGESDANTILDFLAAHPKTASYVSGKMARWLLGYDPPQSVLDAAQAAFLSSNGEIKQVIRAILTPRTFSLANVWRHTKVKRPTHFAVSLLRAVGAEVTDGLGALDDMTILGHTPYDWGPPTGYPDTAEAWANLLWPRWRFATDLCNGSYAWTNLQASDLLSLLNFWPRPEWAEGITRVLTGGLQNREQTAEVQAFIDSQVSPDNVLIGEAFGLGAITPGFQKY